MSRIDGASSLYKASNKLNGMLNSLFWICFFIPFVLLLLPGNSSLSRFLVIIQCIISVIYVVGMVIDQEWLFFEAENLRRKLWIDNSFNSRVTSQSTKDYYNNQFPPFFY